MDMFLNELGIGARNLRRRPVFAFLAISALALGLGANAVIFSLVNAVVLRPLPYPAPESLLALWESNSEEGDHLRVSPPTYFDWRERANSFEEMAAFVTGNLVLTGDAEPERIATSHVTASFFPLLRAKVVEGRLFTPEEDQPGAEPVILLSYSLFQRRFGADPAVIGQQMATADTSFTIIGIMPPGFDFPEGTRAWLPAALPNISAMRGARYINVLGRLAPTVSLRQANSEMETIASRLGEEDADMRGYGATLVPLREELVGNVRPALLLMLGAVAFMALILCTNVSSMLLARGAARTQEISLRLALGASRLRVAQPLVAESLLLASIGGVIGLLLAAAGVRLFVAAVPNSIPRLGSVEVNGSVVLFTFALTMVAALMAALAPAFQAARSDPGRFLAESANGQVRSRSSQRLLTVLSVVAVAATLVLLVGATLLFQSFAGLRRTSIGFEPDGLLTARIVLSRARYAEKHSQSAFFDEVLSRIAALPGVESAGAVTNLPLSGSNMLFDFTIDGRAPATRGPSWRSNYRAVTPGYFKTLGVQRIEGSPPTSLDSAQSPAVAVINQRMAELFWPGESPLGQSVRLAYDGEPRRIIAVVANIRHFGLQRHAEPEIYVPAAQNPWPFMTVVMRTTGDPARLASALRSTVAGLDPVQPVDDIATMTSLIGASLAQPRFFSLVTALFGAVALLCAIAGIYGLVTHSADQRMYEMGIRMSLGAEPRQILRSLVGGGLRPALLGVLAGIAMALALSPLVRGILYGVAPANPLVHVLVGLVLLLAALLGSYFPARRASRRDPMEVLRRT